MLALLDLFLLMVGLSANELAFEQIIGKLSFLSFSLAELEVFSFPSSSTEFSAA